MPSGGATAAGNSAAGSNAETVADGAATAGAIMAAFASISSASVRDLCSAVSSGPEMKKEDEAQYGQRSEKRQRRLCATPLASGTLMPKTSRSRSGSAASCSHKSESDESLFANSAAASASDLVQAEVRRARIRAAARRRGQRRLAARGGADVDRASRVH